MSPLPDAKPANSLLTDSVDALSWPSVSPDSSTPRNGWQRDLACAVRTVPALLEQLGLSPDDVPPLSSAATDSFPVLVPQSFLQRMRPADPQDPLLLQVLPLQAELNTVPGFVADAVGDGCAQLVPGMLQKYHGRALLMTAASCAIHCRYCFRREFPYTSVPRLPADWDPAMEELAGNPDISEAILSGGDPLMLPDSRLEQLISRIDNIDHVDRIRIHTRLPVVLPSRVTGRLLTMLRGTRAQAIMVIHANHANEIAGDCRDAVRKLVGGGLPVLNQAVLLKHINDSVAAQESLCTTLVNNGIIPYYLHQLDRVAGTAHFEVDPETGRNLITQLRSRLPGYAVPQYVQEIQGRDSKTLL